MDLNTATGSSDTDDDTQSQKLLSCAKTVPKYSFPAPSSSVQLVYKECLRNHAANLGSFSLDGCGEFLLQNPTGTEPYMLTCAACGCHWNFHRKVDPISHQPPPSYPIAASSQKHQTSQEMGEAYLAVRHYHAPTYHHKLMEQSTTAVSAPETPIEEVSRGKKRFRTRFAKEQKDEMFAFAEKQGWKIRKANEHSVDDFCKKVGVARGVFIIWMHNNKYTFGNKKDERYGSHLSDSTDSNGTSDDAPNKSHLSTSTGGNNNGGSAKKGDGSSSSA